MSRGAKVRTVKNSRRKPVTTGRWREFPLPDDFDDVARLEFDRIKAALEDRGTLERTDPRLVALAASTYSMIAKAHQAMKGADLTLVAKSGIAMPHPMINVVANLGTRLRGLLNDMGLSPKTSKLAASAPKPDEGEGWAGLLNVG